ncbi:hypothetical protein GCM10023092_27260 [Rurimicrobium arvi]|uniref:SH3b domain-containing protein n=1 Tax=Rurimicrobium arvi TaxID=2049916 RepID=A0ABP8MZB1_9BACT
MKQQEHYYKSFIKKFYVIVCASRTDIGLLKEVFWDAQRDTNIFGKLKSFCTELSAGLPEKKLFQLIDSAKVSEEGLEFGLIIPVNVSATNTIYFELSCDSPSIIEYIWLNDGTSLNSIINNNVPHEKLFLVGSVNDKDGYVNIRNGPSSTAKVTGTLTDRDYFYYIPNGNTDWWQVARTENLKALTGYVHKSRILRFNDMSRSLKNKVRRDRREH